MFGHVQTTNISWGECSKKSVQQGRSHFDARSVLIVREHGKRARTPLAAFFNIPIIEMASESVLTGAEAGENFITLLPGFQLWHPESNWQIQMGVGLPISSDRENDVASLLQVGNHFDWGPLLK